MNGSSLAIDIRKVSGDTHQDSEDFVAVEEPLEIQLCSSGPEGAAAKSISITMRTRKTGRSFVGRVPPASLKERRDRLSGTPQNPRTCAGN
jgi:hypothetical protein